LVATQSFVTIAGIGSANEQAFEDDRVMRSKVGVTAGVKIRFNIVWLLMLLERLLARDSLI
jgi:hypothetical protein